MSIAVMDRVWKESPAKGGALLTLLALADWANDDGFAYPSVPKLAEKARLSRRQVQNILRELVQSGDVIVIEQRGRNHTNLYQLVRYVGITQNVKDLHVSPPVENVKSTTQNVKSTTQNVKSATENVQSTSPKPSRTVSQPSGEPSGKRGRATQKAAPKTLLPDDFGISDRLVKWAGETGFTVEEMEDQLPRFKNNASMKQHKYADWAAAFQNWMHNAEDWGHLDKFRKPANVTQFQNTPRTKHGGWGPQDYAAYAEELERQGR